MTTLHGFNATPHPSSKLREYLEEVRGAYVERLARAIAKRGEQQTGVEILVERTDDDEPERLFRMFRADMLLVDGEAAQVEVIEGPFAIDDVVFDFAGVPITIHDLAWENCLVSAHGPDPNLEAIGLWAVRWLDVAEQRAPDARGLRHAIHQVSRPRRHDGDWSIHVDFGSADVDAFIELLQIATFEAAAVDIWIPQ